MHYLLAFHRGYESLIRFMTFNDLHEAIAARVEVEQEEDDDEIEVVVIGAPDLYTAIHNHPEYFANHDGSFGIAWCFFCRSYLVLTEERGQLDHSDISTLTKMAEYEGHCLFCHENYPVHMRKTLDSAPQNYPQYGMAYHSQSFCAALSEIEVNPRKWTS